MPAVTYQLISTEPLGHSHSGPNHLRRVRYQRNCFAEKGQRDIAISLADAVTKSLDGFKGVWGSTEVQSIWLDNAVDGTVAQTQRPLRTIDFFITYLEE